MVKEVNITVTAIKWKIIAKLRRSMQTVSYSGVLVFIKKKNL